MRHIILCLLLVCHFFSFSQFESKKNYVIEQCSTPPKIDGKLNEELWRGINIAKDFTQIEPNNGQSEKFSQRTEVKICYDNRNIYFGAMMFDSSPDSILKELSKRDEENKNFDGFGIFINPFNDGQIEYKFFVTAAGVQIDAKISPTGEDLNWSSVWKSSVSITNAPSGIISGELFLLLSLLSRASKSLIRAGRLTLNPLSFNCLKRL